MGILQKARSSIARTFRNLTSRASSVLKSLGRSPSPLADRLLSDALRIAEIPSPTEREEQRAAFVIKQLSALGLNPMTDEEGNIVTRLTCQRPDHSAPNTPLLRPLINTLASTRKPLSARRHARLRRGASRRAWSGRAAVDRGDDAFGADPDPQGYRVAVYGGSHDRSNKRHGQAASRRPPIQSRNRYCHPWSGTRYNLPAPAGHVQD